MLPGWGQPIPNPQSTCNNPYLATRSEGSQLWEQWITLQTRTKPGVPTRNGNFKGEVKVREVIRSADSIESFTKQLKTFLFRRPFDYPVGGRSVLLFITFGVELSSSMTFSVCCIFVLSYSMTSLYVAYLSLCNLWVCVCEKCYKK